MSYIEQTRNWARQIKRDTVAVYFAARDQRTPMPARCLALSVAAYALSPIDLIPDFIPLLGYLDDVVLVPCGIWLALKMIPPAVMADSRERAQTMMANGKPVNRAAAVVIVTIWLVLAALGIALGIRLSK